MTPTTRKCECHKHGIVKPLKVFIIDVSGSMKENEIEETAYRILGEMNKAKYNVETYAFAKIAKKLEEIDLQAIVQLENHVAIDVIRSELGNETSGKTLFDILEHIVFNSFHLVEVVIVSDMMIKKE
jgi:uncharacterized protein with von Willebrand factor type A (vWA) domain